MQLRPALFAIILVRNFAVLENSHTSTMLPDVAVVTRNEERTSVFRLRVSLSGGFAQRWARIVLLSANASCDLFFLYNIFIGVCNLFGSFGLFGQVWALAATRRLADVFAREWVWRCGFLVVV
jgi:hypothetical protein